MDDNSSAIRRFCVRVIMAVFAAMLLQSPSHANGPAPLNVWDFEQIAPKGFGNPDNAYAWSMVWYKERLYVGTQPQAECVQKAIFAQYSGDPTFYPPGDLGIHCPDQVEDLEVPAEIWCWDPATRIWDMVYRSPVELPVAGAPGKFVARDIGFRDMMVYTEPDGTEALYVSGFCSRDYNRDLPPPRILRSTDGMTFDPIPQDPGTFLGDLDLMEGITLSGFNRMFTHKERFYVGVGGAYGHAVLLESERPWEGNDSFRVVSPPGATLTGVASYNGQLYIATGAQPVEGVPPFEILRTDATGPAPYTYTTVLPNGGYNEGTPSTTIVKMYVYKNRLWAGSNRPTELYRINPDDTWDVIVGPPRQTPDGVKYPLSGLDEGFDWGFNIHVHQMEEHEDWLYMGSNDYGNQNPWRYIPYLVNQIGAQFGFDLYRTQDGHYLHEITVNGLEGISAQFSARNLVSTPEGLFLGSLSNHEGCAVWQGKPRGLVNTRPPTRLEIEPWQLGGLLHWEPSPDAVRYHIVASTWGTAYRYQTVAITSDTVYGFPFLWPQLVHVAVVAETAEGHYSPHSNVVRWRSPAPPLTFGQLLQITQGWGADPTVRQWIATAQQRMQAQDYAGAMDAMTTISDLVKNDPTFMAPWHAEDFEIYASKLRRRLGLAEKGLVGMLSLF